MLIQKPRLPLRDILTVGLLPSPAKRLVYRLKGYRIGRGVALGFGSVVIGDDVEIGDGVRIGLFTIVRGRRIRLGPHVQIGATTFLDTPRIEIGEGTKINEQVFVGGLQFPDSELIVGRNCQIMQMSFVNPTRSIRIGDDSGIGGDCLLFGHTSWLSEFDGYPVEFAPIEIGRSVSVAWRVFILPGTRIGDGAVIGANSLVRGTIPERCLAVGFPARVVSKAPEFPREVSAADKERILHKIIMEMIECFRGSGLDCSEVEAGWRVSRARRRFLRTSVDTWRIIVATQPLDDDSITPLADRFGVLVSLRRIPEQCRRNLTRQGTTLVDIEDRIRSDQANELGEEVILYFRRHGVRLLRWRDESDAVKE